MSLLGPAGRNTAQFPVAGHDAALKDLRNVRDLISERAAATREFRL